MQPARRPRPILSVRNLLIALGFVALALITVRIVYGSGTKPAATRTRLHCVATGTRHRRCPRSQALRTRVRRVVYRPTGIQVYKMGVLRVFNRHRRTFDFIAYNTGIKTMDQLTSACANDLTRISIMTDVVNGVPHPGPWYSAVAGFHRRVLQAYHDMASALEVCSTGAGNGDGNSVATARQDLIRATREFHAVDRAAYRAWKRVSWLRWRAWKSWQRALRRH